MSEFKKSPDVTVEGFRKLSLTNDCIIDFEVRKDKSLSGDEKIFFGELKALASERGYCSGTDEEFAELKEVSVRTLQRYLTSLEKSGFIKREAVSIVYSDKNGDRRWKKDRKIWINHGKLKKFTNTKNLVEANECNHQEPEIKQKRNKYGNI
jgi:SOS-response transcriptional repressor LexA